MSAVLEATGVTLRYGAVTAVDDVDIEVEPGTLHGVIGPNGAGKSSFHGRIVGATPAVGRQGGARRR
jgi:ABC-type branched-subunit amino acid transport system ATPase component